MAEARRVGADIEPGTVWPRIVDELHKQFVRGNLIQPTVLMDYPVALSPLAKRVTECVNESVYEKTVARLRQEREDGNLSKRRFELQMMMAPTIPQGRSTEGLCTCRVHLASPWKGVEHSEEQPFATSDTVVLQSRT